MGDKKNVIIIGAGTAGLLIANNLQRDFNVRIFDKCEYLNYPMLFRVPLMIGLLFKSKRQKYIKVDSIRVGKNRKVPFFESNILGGSSVMNGCVHVIGDEEKWLRFLKKFNLDKQQFELSIKKLFSRDKFDRDKITIQDAPVDSFDEKFFRFFTSLGYEESDTSKISLKTFGKVVNTFRGPFRTSVIDLLKKKLFKVTINAQVLDILFDKDINAIGVKTNLGEFYADFIILAAGVKGTCELLLKNKSLEKNSNLHSLVGTKVRDHTNLRVNVLTKKKINSLNEISNNFYKSLLFGFKHFLGFRSLMQGTGATSAAHLDLDGDGIVETRIQLLKFRESGRAGSSGRLFSSEPGFSLSITPINPHSNGFIKISHNRTSINPNYLSKTNDMRLLKKALLFCLKILDESYFKDEILKIEERDKIVNNTEDYIRENIYSGYHLIGGTSEIITEDFALMGTKNLFIQDASIFEEHISSNIHSNILISAELFSDKFIKNYGE